MRWWLPSMILVGGAVATLAAGTDTQRLVTLSPSASPKQPVVVSPEKPASVPAVVVTPPPPPTVVKPAHGPSIKALANTLGDLRKPKLPSRQPDTETAAAVSPPQPKAVTPPQAQTAPPPINLLPPPQPTQSSLSDHEVWLHRRMIRVDLMAARDLTLAGQPRDARRILDNAAVHLRLFPMEFGNQQQVGIAIRALDGGDTVTAVRAIIQVINSPFASS